MSKRITRPVWAQIDLDHLAHNIREVRRVTKEDALVTAVIKADGYGHGSVEIGQTLLENGADRFAVATLMEAVELRRAYPETDIMVLGYTPNEDADIVLDNDIIQTVYAVDQAQAMSAEAVKRQKTVRLHVKVDSGMGRLGLQAGQEAVEAVRAMAKLPGVVLEGIFTHFAVADEVDKAYTCQQVKRFNETVEALEKAGVQIPIKHVSNSAAIIDLPELNYNMVRAGIMLYGLYPSHDVSHVNVKLKEVMSLRAKLSLVKELPEGAGISYGLLYTTDHQQRVGTIPLGYADGYTRLYTGKAQVLVEGVKKPIIGRICMDQCMVDLDGTKALRDDEVVLFGKQGENFISIDEVASWIETINYEVVCMISKRVPRVYVRGNQVQSVRDRIGQK